MSEETTKRFWNKGEVRLNSDGSVDEVVARNVDFHMEQMDVDSWWIGISGKQGRRLVINLYKKGKTVHCSVEDDGFHSSGIQEGFK